MFFKWNNSQENYVNSIKFAFFCLTFKKKHRIISAKTYLTLSTEL